MKTAISTKGHEPDIERIERIERIEQRLVRVEPPANQGVVDWLLRCPEKGWFAPIASESTDTL